MGIISFVGLGVRDVEVSARFYSALFDRPLPDLSTGFVILETGNTKLGFYPWDALAEDAHLDAQGSGFRGLALAHNVASTELVDRTWARAVELGAKAIKKPEKVFWGGYSGYFADPDGHLWEVAWNPHYSIDNSDIGDG